MLTKTPSAMLTSSSEIFKSGNDLYRLAPRTDALIRTPGKQKRQSGSSIRSPLGDRTNTPVKSRQYDDPPRQLTRSSNRPYSISTSHGIKSLRSSFRKIKNKHLEFLKSDSVATDDEESQQNHDGDDGGIDETKKQNLNLSYLQSLPANSLVVLDNDSTWREVYLSLLKTKLSDIHVNSLVSSLNVSHIIYNMTKISEKGVVQLHGSNRPGDLPKWTLSAMKCLANWPKPFQALMNPEGLMPNYNGFEIDVFNVVKEYFTSLAFPLTTFELFDIFVSAFIRAEAVSAHNTFSRKKPHRNSYIFAVTPKPYLETDLDFSKPSTSTPSGYYHPGDDHDDCFKNYGHMLTTNERMAHIRQTLQVLPQPTNISLDSQSPQSVYSSRLNANMSPTAIMRNFLPPNT